MAIQYDTIPYCTILAPPSCFPRSKSWQKFLSVKYIINISIGLRFYAACVATFHPWHQNLQSSKALVKQSPQWVFTDRPLIGSTTTVYSSPLHQE